MFGGIRSVKLPVPSALPVYLHARIFHQQAVIQIASTPKQKLIAKTPMISGACAMETMIGGTPNANLSVGSAVEDCLHAGDFSEMLLVIMC